MVGQNSTSAPDGRRGIHSGVCITGKEASAALYTNIVGHLSHIVSRSVRAHQRHGTIFVKCSLVDTDFLMSSRPHILPESSRQDQQIHAAGGAEPDQADLPVLNVRRMLPNIYGLTRMLELALHDPPDLPATDVCARLAVALGEIGKVEDVVSGSPDKNTYIVTFEDYDSVDVLILLCTFLHESGAPLPVTASPGARSSSPSRLMRDCRPSTTALSHLVRVGPPDLSAAGLMLIKVTSEAKSSPEDGASTLDKSRSCSESPHGRQSVETDTSVPVSEIVEASSPLIVTGSIGKCESSTSSPLIQPRLPKRQRTEESISEATNNIKKESISPNPCKRIKKEVQPNRTVRQPRIQNSPANNTQLLADPRLQHWELHKYVGGKRCGESIDLRTLGFPIGIGRDPARAKIHVEGPGMQHVSRLHAELSEGESTKSLYLDCCSSNGTVIDGVFVEKGGRAELYDGSTFILGDVSYLEGSDATNKELRFTLHWVADEDSSKENCNGALGPFTTMSCESNFDGQRDNAITISDSEDENEMKPSIRELRIPVENLSAEGERLYDIYNEVIVLSDDDDIPEENQENNQFLKMVMKFKDEPIDDEDEDEEVSIVPLKEPDSFKGTVPANSLKAPIPATNRNVAGSSHTSRNRLGSISSPHEPSPRDQEPVTSPLATIPPVARFNCPISGTPTCDFFKLNVTTSDRCQTRRRASNDSSTGTNESVQVGLRIPSSPSTVAQSGRPLPHIRIGFDSFRRCLLDLQLNLRQQQQQPCQAKFINFVRNSTIPKNTKDFTQLLFSCFCLEASARVEMALNRRNRERSHPYSVESLPSTLVSQKQVADGVLRVRLIAACKNGAGRPLESASMILLHAKCIRRGGKQLRARTLLGLVYSSERKDRRDRSGTVAVPDALTRTEQMLDVVDDVLVDINAHELEGLQLQSDHLVQLERLCEVNELKKVVSMRQMKPSQSKFLLGPPYSASSCAIWSPDDASAAQSSPSDAMQRTMTRIAHIPKMSSEQSVVVCAALAQILSQPTAVPENTLTAMLVHGAAGSGKTATLQEIALQAVLARPQESVLVFCKWPQAADQLALKLQDLIESRGLGSRVRVTRAGRSRHPRVLPLTLAERMKQMQAKEHEGSLRKLKNSVAETRKLIEGLQHSLEDQLTELSPMVKRRKLQEIAQFESVLLNEQQQLSREEKRLHQNDLIQGSSAGRRRTILESSNILVCGYIDVETSIIGYAFDRPNGRRFSLVLIDQAQEVFTTDLVPLMQLPAKRLIFFGDRSQSGFCKPKHPIVRNTDLLKLAAFERMTNACSQKVFNIRTQWRLPVPLDRIVNAMFYGGRIRSGVVTARGSTDHPSKLAGLTMINVSPAELLFTRDLPRVPVQMIQNVAEALAPHCNRIQVVVSFSSNNVPPSLLPPKLAAQCEAQFVGPDLLAHIGDPDVIVLPLFNQPFIEDLSRRDQFLLCTIMTRPTTSLVILGHLEAAGKAAEKIDELVQRAKRVNRYINETPTWLTGISPQNLSQYLMR